MKIMSSFRLKTYCKESFQISVSILTNNLAIFLQHVLKIHAIQKQSKRKQAKAKTVNS